MRGRVAKLCLTLLLLAVTKAQLYNDLGAAYTDQSSVDTNEDDDAEGAYDYDYNEYGEEYMYNGADADLANIIFSQEKLKELYSCLCLGTFQECNIHYKLEEDNWNVNTIEKNGTFQGFNELCKYYICSHSESSDQITCLQLEQRSEACETGNIAQFFRFKSHVCCGITCVGLFWHNLEEQLSLFQNSTEVESCDTSCLCPFDNDGKAPPPEKITASPTSNETHIDTYIIHKPDKQNTTTELPTTPTGTFTITSVDVYQSTSTTVNNTLDNLFDKSPLSNSNAEDKNLVIIIIAAISALVISIIIIIIVVCVLRKCRQQREVTLEKNTDSEPGNNPVIVSESQPSYYSAPKASEPLPVHYSRLPSSEANSVPTSVYGEAPKAPALKNGIGRSDNINIESPLLESDSSRTGGTFNTNRGKEKKNVNSDAEESARSKNNRSKQGQERSRKNQDSEDPSCPNEDVNVRQPLLIGQQIKESVV